jgi:hypothetical protein
VTQNDRDGGRSPSGHAADLRADWDRRWDEALALWSKFVRLGPPRWCTTKAEEKEEELADSFAMIRLVDHAVVLSSRQIIERGLSGFALEIMAHEIGHHVYCPGDLTDHGRMLARVRRGLPTKEQHAPFIANLYADLLINNRLQRSAGLDMCGVYRALASRGEVDALWTLYMRIYEHLWSLERGSLATGKIDDRLEVDAQLGARLVRVCANDWLRGAGRFAALCFPYVGEKDGEQARLRLGPWLDTRGAGKGGAPDGLTEIDDFDDDAIHPAFDPAISGVDGGPNDGDGTARSSDDPGGHRPLREHRDIGEYGELLRALGVDADAAAIAVRYYRERALPHLVRFPTRPSKRGTEPVPEGVDTWEPGSPLERIDWIESVERSPFVIPGVTTVERTYGASPGPDARREAIDLYVGIDCSGSMPNPRRSTSYPAIAGAILGLSALRAGARVKVVLSGEPGKTLAMPDFSRNEREVLSTLTAYLGTGYAFGIKRLADTFDARTPRDRPAHIAILSDSDLFVILDDAKEQPSGWEVAKRALDSARGGGTVVLHMPTNRVPSQVERLRADGWSVHFVSAMEELVAFARAFAKRTYEEEARSKR